MVFNYSIMKTIYDFVELFKFMDNFITEQKKTKKYY